MLVELTAELGVQSMSFLANHLSTNHLMCSSTVPQLCANLSAFTNNTHDKEPQMHFILAEKHSLFRSIPSEVKRAVSGSKLVVVYMDVYTELDSLEAIQGKKPVTASRWRRPSSVSAKTPAGRPVSVSSCFACHSGCSSAWSPPAAAST